MNIRRLLGCCFPRFAQVERTRSKAHPTWIPSIKQVRQAEGIELESEIETRMTRWISFTYAVSKFFDKMKCSPYRVNLDKYKLPSVCFERTDLNPGQIRDMMEFNPPESNIPILPIVRHYCIIWNLRPCDLVKVQSVLLALYGNQLSSISLPNIEYLESINFYSVCDATDKDAVYQYHDGLWYVPNSSNVQGKILNEQDLTLVTAKDMLPHGGINAMLTLKKLSPFDGMNQTQKRLRWNFDMLLMANANIYLNADPELTKANYHSVIIELPKDFHLHTKILKKR